MKKLWWVALVLVLWVKPTHAQDSTGMRLTDFSSDITINRDASLDVQETILVHYDTEHHGIFRTIPQEASFNGKRVTLPISGLRVTQDGQAATVDQSTDGHRTITAKIGDPDVLIDGDHTYVIRYHVAAAVNFFSNFDELNWNVTGTEWDLPIDAVEATLHVPDQSVTPTTLCYTGPKGSTVQNCQASSSGGQATYSAHDFLTVVSHWPKGVVTKPADYDQIRASGQWRYWLVWLWWFLAAALPLGTGWVMYRRWSEQGRDPEERATVIAQYEPPVDVRPSDAVIIMQQSVNKHSLPSTIVDLAVRGYLRIEEIEKKAFLNMGRHEDYALVAVKPADDHLRPYEQQLLSAFFDTASIKDDHGRVILSKMKSRQQKLYPLFQAVRTEMTTDVTTRGYFPNDPRKVRQMYLGIGIGIAAAGYLVTQLGELLPGGALILAAGVIAAGVIVAFFGYAMPKRTAKGAEADWHLKGFKLYLETAEKYRIQWQEKEHIFETFLPYAMALGVAEKWTKTFADVNLPAPSWYVSSTGTWNSLYAWNALSHFDTAMAAATIPASGGSAGGSGGGGGGGGGGGW